MRSVALKIITIAILPLLFASLMGCGPDTSETKPEDTNKQICTPNPCQNGGTCQVNNGSAVCNCPTGYTGDKCETAPVHQPVDPCATNPCQNGGTCQANNGSAVCTCPNGYSGDHCETAPTQTVDPCASNPCQNGGTCSDVDGHFKCTCPDTHHGSKCQLEVVPGPFVFEIDLKNTFAPSFTIRTHMGLPYKYNFNVDCNSDGTLEGTNVKKDYTCHYTAAGKYTITLTGDYPALFLRSDSSVTVTAIKKWGDQRWKSMASMLSYNSDLETIEDTNPPILDDVADFSHMFMESRKFNGDISTWDVSSARYMEQMFLGASKFNTDISAWDTSNVVDMDYMFSQAGSFNQDLSNWDVSNVHSCKRFAYYPPVNWPLSKRPKFTKCAY